jgi:hypothetical protein
MTIQDGRDIAVDKARDAALNWRTYGWTRFGGAEVIRRGNAFGVAIVLADESGGIWAAGAWRYRSHHGEAMAKKEAEGLAAELIVLAALS